MGKRRLRGNLLALCISLRRRSREKCQSLLSGYPCQNRWEWHTAADRLNIRKKFFTVKVAKHWYRLPREVVDAHACQCSKDKF